MTTRRVRCAPLSMLSKCSQYTAGKELRLKQQHLWTAASLADMLRRFKNLGKSISEFSDCVFIYTGEFSCLTDAIVR